MAKQNDTGVYQKENGYWEYRLVIRIDGKRVCRKKCTDEHGNRFRTKREATAAREAAIVALRVERTTKPKPTRRLVKEVFEEFCAEGRKDRAYQTIRKQDSIWENHLRERFGNRYIDEISSAEVVDYLSELYYDDGLAFKYVESFLKMFYLIFGQAYSRNYTTHCQDKSVLIDIRKAVDASPELRSKKDLIETFIAVVNDVEDVMAEWHDFVAEEREKELIAIIQSEKLKEAETRRFVDNAFRDGEIKTTGTDIDGIMPPVSRFGGGNRAAKKQTIIEKLKAFFERFFGIG